MKRIKNGERRKKASAFEWRKKMDEVLQERLMLAQERISQLKEENISDEAFAVYFKKEAEWFLELFWLRELLASGEFEKLGLEELQDWNRKLYGELLPENYEKAMRIRLRQYGSWEQSSVRLFPRCMQNFETALCTFL